MKERDGGRLAEGSSQWPLRAPGSLFGRERSSSVQGVPVFGNVLEKGDGLCFTFNHEHQWEGKCGERGAWRLEKRLNSNEGGFATFSFKM